jgi:hypothetical protein
MGSLMEVDQENAVAQFLALARSCQDRNLTATGVIEEVVRFYRDVRIAGADVEDDGDMLLFQWGDGEHLILSEPTDFRSPESADYEFDGVESKYLDFTRQVFVAGDEGDEDFDESAIQMSITLIYGPASGKEQAGNVWIATPSRVEHDLKKHAAAPLVTELIKLQPSRIVATVDVCG